MGPVTVFYLYAQTIFLLLTVVVLFEQWAWVNGDLPLLFRGMRAMVFEMANVMWLLCYLLDSV